jgi:hypothetical protein
LPDFHEFSYRAQTHKLSHAIRRIDHGAIDRVVWQILPEAPITL